MALPRMSKVWMNGELVDIEAASVSVMSPTLHTGWGVFENISTRPTGRGVAIFQLRSHLMHLAKSAHTLGIDMPFEIDEVLDGVKAVSKKNNLRNGFIRVLVYLEGDDLFYGKPEVASRVAICAWDRPSMFSDDALNNGLRVCTSTTKTISPEAVPAKKSVTGAGVTRMLAMRSAKRARYDEAILLDSTGHIDSATDHIIAMVRDGELVLREVVNPTVMDETLHELARHLEIPTSNASLRPEDLYAADEVLCASVMSGILAIHSVDDRVVNPSGPVTRNLNNLFSSITTGMEPRFDHMLNFLN